MFSITLEHVLTLITHYGYIIIFPIAFFEGPMVAVISGFITSLGLLNFWLVFGALMAGEVFGDAAYYALGRWSRRGFLKRWGKYIGASPDKIEKLEKVFFKHHWKILAFAKTQPIGSVFLISAGVARAPFWKFVWYNFLVSIPKVLLFELIGFYFGKSFSKIGTYIDYAGIGSFLLAVILVAAYLLYRRYTRVTNIDIEQ